jgi:hypothetical protein
LKNSFDARRHEVGGSKVSLDDIENNALRPLLGYRAHAVLVCAARSCPPLQRFAYTTSQLDEQIDTAYRAWLNRPDLNRFMPDTKKIEISNIFNWYKNDFDKAGGVSKVLARYSPQQYREFLATGAFETSYLPYNWALNDQSNQVRQYGLIQSIRDWVLNCFQFWK